MFPRLGDLVGDYKVAGTLGSGGMGAVYKVEHAITGRIEAMKVLASDLNGDSGEIERFSREIRVQARLHHPNIAAVYNAFRAGSNFVMVMEYVEGESLQTILRRGPITLKTGLDYACQVLRALAYAHAEGVVHRDVTPANIIVTDDGSVKLTDFGLAATATDRGLPHSRAPVGSPWYMSPEQVTANSNVDLRSDIYSMGAVLSEILTGRKLFDVDTPFAAMQAHVETVPLAPSIRNRDVPRAYDAIVLKALAKDPADRFQSADEFRRALESARTAASKAAALRVSRLVAALILVPAALAAGFYAIRYGPRIVRLEKLEWRALKVPRFLQSLTKPTRAAPKSAPPKAREVREARGPGLPGPLPHGKKAAPSPVHAARPESLPRPASGIRVTGGEVVDPAPLVVSGCPAPKKEAATPPDPARAPPTEVAEHQPPAAVASPAAAKPQKTGNRFWRALGKIVPFRRATKDDSNKP